ncbi:MAG: hypothetical protein RIF41_36035, partial [Polyangiaceae bacterium]
MTHALRRRLALATALVVGGAAVVALMRCRQTNSPSTPRGNASAGTGALVRWSDDAVRLRSADDDGVMLADEVELFGLRGETLAFQLVVTAGEQPLQGVTITLGGIEGVVVDHFVTFEVPMKRRSGGVDPGVSLGWDDGARPPGPEPGGTLVDPLIPIELASHPAASSATPPWDYPMTVPARRRRVLWVELFLEETAPAGEHRATITVASGSGTTSVPMKLEIGRRTLPYAAAKTMVFVEPETLSRRVGSGAIAPTLQLLHRHHVTPVLPLTEAEQLDRSPMKELLTGELFTERHGYDGPGRRIGADLAVLGMYGSLGMPDDAALERVDRLLARLDALAPNAQRFLYAVDEECESP